MGGNAPGGLGIYYKRLYLFLLRSIFEETSVLGVRSFEHINIDWGSKFISLEGCVTIKSSLQYLLVLVIGARGGDF